MDTNFTLGNGADQSRDGVSSMIKEKRAQLHGAIEKATGAAQPAIERMTATAHTGVDQVSDAIVDVSGSLAERTRQLGDVYNRVAESGRNRVRNSPATSVVLALALGYGLSKLFGSRHT